MKRISTALAALVACIGAQAATVSFEYGLPVIQSTTEINQTGSLSLFNSSLGTLTGASLEVFGAATFAYTGANTAAQEQEASITSSTSLRWNSSNAAVAAFLTATSDRINLSDTSGDLIYAVGQTRSFGPITKTGSNTDNLSTILASLQGVGDFTINCRSVSGLTVDGGGGNIATTQSTQAGCGARIIYTYTAAPTGVPEPTSLALVGLALVGAGAAARRRAA